MMCSRGKRRAKSAEWGKHRIPFLRKVWGKYQKNPQSISTAAAQRPWKDKFPASQPGDNLCVQQERYKILFLERMLFLSSQKALRAGKDTLPFHMHFSKGESGEPIRNVLQSPTMNLSKDLCRELALLFSRGKTIDTVTVWDPPISEKWRLLCFWVNSCWWTEP